MVLHRIDYLHQLRRHFGFAVLLFSIVAGTGCGKSGNQDPLQLGGNPGPLGSPTPSTIQLRMGSEPSDRVISLSLTLNSLQARNSGSTNNLIDLLTDPVTVEFAHSAIITEPVSIRDIYQDTYSALVFPEMTGSITFYDDSGQKVVQAITVPAQTVPYQFVLGKDPMVLNVWVDIQKSFTIGATANRRRKASRYQSSAGMVGVNPLIVSAQSQTPNPSVGQPESGSITFLVGTVSSVDLVNQKIALQPASGDAITVSYSSSGLNATDFEECTPATVTGMLVEMAGVTQSDGSVLATEVEAAGLPTDSQLYGVFSGYNPSGLFAMVVEGGNGVNVNSALVGKSISVDWINDDYGVNDGGLIDMTNTDLHFDESYVYPGQFVEVEWDTLVVPDTDVCSLDGTPCNAGYIQPSMIELQQQTITGTVSGLNYNPLTQTGSFTLTPSSNAAIRIQNPGLTITVNQIPQTYLRGLSSGFNNGSTVNVRGLLFATTPNGGYIPSVSSPVDFVLVAGRISGSN